MKRTFIFSSLFLVIIVLAGCGGSKAVSTAEQEQAAKADSAAAEPQRFPSPAYSRDVDRRVVDILAGEEAEAGGESRELMFSPVYFALDMSDLSPETRSTLGSHAEMLKANPGVSLMIEGHCDERGTIEYNLALGERRATSVKNYLVNLGVPASRLYTISYGKERPANPGHSEAAWAENRRAEFRIIE